MRERLFAADVDLRAEVFAAGHRVSPSWLSKCALTAS